MAGLFKNIESGTEQAKITGIN